MEVFKDVKGYEGYYEISNLGRVRSTSYKGVKILKPFITKKGYLNVIFCVKRKTEHKLIHRLVAEAFIPNVNNYSTVNHKDENKLNNCVENLEWLSVEDNNRYSNKKMLTKEQVLQIPSFIKEGICNTCSFVSIFLLEYLLLSSTDSHSKFSTQLFNLFSSL